MGGLWIYCVLAVAPQEGQRGRGVLELSLSPPPDHCYVSPVRWSCAASRGPQTAPAPDRHWLGFGSRFSSTLTRCSGLTD